MFKTDAKDNDFVCDHSFDDKVSKSPPSLFQTPLTFLRPAAGTVLSLLANQQKTVKMLSVFPPRGLSEAALVWAGC